MRFQKSRRLLGVCYIVVKVTGSPSIDADRALNADSASFGGLDLLSAVRLTINIVLFFSGLLVGCHGDRIVPYDLRLVAGHLLIGLSITLKLKLLPFDTLCVKYRFTYSING